MNNSPKTESPLVLIVDDEPLICTALTKILAAHEYRAVSASSAREVMDIIDEHPDLAIAIVDFMLHDSIDGIEVIDRLRSKFMDIRIVLMSGLPAESVLPAASKIGNCQFLKKPFFTPDVLAAIQSSGD